MKLILFCLLIFCITTSGCKKYLDKKPSTGITVPVTLTDLQSLLDNSGAMNRWRTPSSAEASADDYFLPEDILKNQNEHLQALYRWEAYENYSFPNDWSDGYMPIYNANYCLEQIDKIPFGPQNALAWNTVKGSAYFYRAYYFLQLLGTYAQAFDPSTSNQDLGIVLRKSSDINQPSARSSVAKCYAQVLSDAMASILLLPNLPSHVYRPSKAGAYGLVARTYLWMGVFDSAAKYSALSLAIKNDLMDFKDDDQVSKDFSDFMSPFSAFNKEIVFYSEATLYAAGLISEYSANIDTILYDSYGTGDLRKDAFFTLGENDYQVFKGFYALIPIPWLFTGIATDELYLIKAESNARLGKSEEALGDLNHLLSKRYNQKFVPITEQRDLLNLILKERRKELVMRGLRFMDIKRLNKKGANYKMKRRIGTQEISLPANDNRFALPLPREIIVQTGMVQNPE